MRLRRWQVDFVSKAIDAFKKGLRNFFLVASPGSGKSVACAEIAARLYDAGLIDLILCLSPSSEVRDGIYRTLNQRMPALFHDGLGSIGESMTYQKLLTLKDAYLEPAKRKRVLVICDEIHHCSGGGDAIPNAWGKKILNLIFELADYTLLMSGTPWRTDCFPIALADYCNNDELIINYQYGLSQAVADGVCRQPVITLVDNDACKINEEKYRSIHEALSKTELMYQQILENEKALNFILKLSVNRLLSLRLLTPDAGGVVVAHSVEHARRIKSILETEFNQTAVVVTYKEKKPQAIIDKFRHGATHWIVSVGMIAEGTDIPRLQVCCHLTTVRTELYFRQVLGRILRVRSDDNCTEGFLYTFAEPQLKLFANRVQEELPGKVVLRSVEQPTQITRGHVAQSNRTALSNTIAISASPAEQTPEKNSHLVFEKASFTFDFSENFREQVIRTYAKQLFG